MRAYVVFDVEGVAEVVGPRRAWQGDDGIVENVNTDEPWPLT